LHEHEHEHEHDRKKKVIRNSQIHNRIASS